MMSAIAILAAIIHRGKTGEGQRLDVSMLDGVISWLSIHAGKYLMDGELPKRGEMHLPDGMPVIMFIIRKTDDHVSGSLGT